MAALPEWLRYGWRWSREAAKYHQRLTEYGIEGEDPWETLE